MIGDQTMTISGDTFDFCECEICGRALKPEEFEVCKHCENKHGLGDDEGKRPDTPRREDDWQ
jgi:ribosome-binding protein aMBF1 (putative translation factor)